MCVFFEIDYYLRAKLGHTHLCISHDSYISAFSGQMNVGAINQGMK